MLAHVQFSNGNMTCLINPICSALEQLKIINSKSLNANAIAFLLRHFSKLHNFHLTDKQSHAILLLHKQQQKGIAVSSKTTQRVSKELALSIQWTVNAPFQGTYFLILCFLTIIMTDNLAFSRSIEISFLIEYCVRCQ